MTIVAKHPFEELLSDPAATAKVGQVADWLLSMDWPKADETRLRPTIQQHQEDYKWSNLRQNYEALAASHKETLEALPSAMRLEGVGTSKLDVLIAKEKEPFGGVRDGRVPSVMQKLAAEGKLPAGGIRKHRSDIFPQSFLHAKRGIDERGKMVIQVHHRHDHKFLGVA